MNKRHRLQSRLSHFILVGIIILAIGFSNSLVIPARANQAALTNPGTTGLVSWWSLNESYGVRYDSHGSNLLNDYFTVGSSIGKQGNAALFDPIAYEYLSITDNSSISMGNVDFTIGGWVNLNSLDHLRTLIAKGASNGANQNFEYLLEYDPDVSAFIFIVGNGTTYGQVINTTPSTSTWYFLTAWHDSTAGTIHLQVNDGEPVSATGTSMNSSYAMMIGKAGEYDGGLFDGLIDEVFMYKRVLTADERAWLYNSGNGRAYSELNPAPPPPPTGTNPGTASLVSWWQLNETVSTRSDSHSSNHLTDNATVGYDVGKQGNAASFNSVATEYLSITDNSSISMGNIDFTIGGWVNLSSLSGLRAMIAKGASNGANKNFEYALEYDPSLNAFLFMVGNGSTYQLVTNTTPTVSTWYFLTAWHDSGADTINLQVNNGAPISAPYSGGSMDSGYLMAIGRVGAYNGGYFNGLIDEVFMYKRLLTAEERTWLHNSGNGRSYSELLPPSATSTPTPPATWTPTPSATATFTSTNTPTFTPTATPVSGYDRVAAVNYADTWAHNRNPDFANVLPIGEIYFGCGCNNCTNFSSQVLLAGGYPLHGVPPYDWVEYWWYTSTSSSSSWRYAPALKNYIQSHPGEFSNVNQVSMLEAGDLIILDLHGSTPSDPPDNIPDHMIVQGFFCKLVKVIFAF